MTKTFIPLLCICMCLSAVDQTLAPFGVGTTLSTKPIKPQDVKSQALDCFAAERAALWTVEGLRKDQTDKVFALEVEDGTGVMRIWAGRCDLGHTTVRAFLPG